jgi:hypothetical protein
VVDESQGDSSQLSPDESHQLIDNATGVIDEAHMLLENLPHKINYSQPQDIGCSLCRKIGRELFCIKCRKGFHVNCFAAFHYRGLMTTCHKALLDVVFKSDHNPSLGLPSKYAPTSMAHMKLPAAS